MMHQTTDLQKTNLMKLMVAIDWYNWNNAFINNVRAWKLEDIVFKKALLMIKPCLPDLRDISYLKKPNIPTLSLIAEGYI
jgi:hypothetical protein